MLEGYHIEKKPIKYQTRKEELRFLFKTLTPLERLVYCTYQVNTLREIATLIKKHYATVSRIYIRACEKIEAQKRSKNATNLYRVRDV